MNYDEGLKALEQVFAKSDGIAQPMAPVLCGPDELVGAILQTVYLDGAPPESFVPGMFDALRRAVKSFVEPAMSVRFLGMSTSATYFPDQLPFSLHRNEHGAFIAKYTDDPLDVRVVSTDHPNVFVVLDDTDEHNRYELWVEVERCVYPPKVYQGQQEVDYECYLHARETKKVGDTLFASAGAPGVGHRIDRITRIDETGVYGVEVENTIWVPEGDFYE